MKLYIAATPDKYELPVFISESGTQLARMCGVNVRAVFSGICKQRRPTKNGKPHRANKGTKYKFFAVEV